ncbi:MAG: alpha-hydroxy-acid oxidizing protein [Gammaproteobacteria bacterium]|nr:alpha-hydroxy-acid oxidizing protein [Gammaproteobacteria bacterium]
MQDIDLDRRELLGFLLRSPLLWAAAAALPDAARARPELAVPEAVSDALDVFQIERAARARLDLPTIHFIVSGADDGKTMQANRDAFDDWAIRVRRLIDVSRIDLSREVLGEKLAVPVILAPVGNQQSIHPDGELASARAAKQAGQVLIGSTLSNFIVSEIAREAGPLWFQLYASADRKLTEKLIGGAEEAGCRVLVLTVDSNTRGNREGERWWARAAGGPAEGTRAALRLGNFEGYPGPPRVGDAALDWKSMDWIRSRTRMKLVLKGIVTREDTELALAHGVDGIVVSNHGGRQEESLRATLGCLPEVVEASAGRVPVLIDGGFRRGTDIFKALALGASAVCIGRPYLWGLGAFGEEGVARVLVILREELKRIMQFAGTTSLAAINASYLERRS